MANPGDEADYREQASPSRTLTLQTAPTSSSALLLIVGLAFVGPVALPLVGAAATRHLMATAFFGLFALVGVWLCVMGYRAIQTRHRFTLTEDELVLEWVRGRKVDRVERIARVDLVDVAVDDAPSSGTPLFGLVLGTRSGEISLSDGRTSWGAEYYEERCRQLAAFLEIPARPR